MVEATPATTPTAQRADLARLQTVRRVAIGFAVLAIVMSIVVLVGWLTAMPGLYTFGGHGRARPNSAVVSIAAALAIIGHLRRWRFVTVASLVVCTVAVGAQVLELVTQRPALVNRLVDATFTSVNQPGIGPKPIAIRVYAQMALCATVWLLVLSPRAVRLTAAGAAVMEFCIALTFFDIQVGGRLLQDPNHPSVGMPTILLLLTLALSVEFALAPHAGRVYDSWIDHSIRSQLVRNITIPIVLTGVLVLAAVLVVWEGNASEVRLVGRIGVASLTLLVVGLHVFVARLAASMRRRLVSLASTAERIEAGGFDVPVGAERDDEIGQLTQAFESMRSSLQERHRMDEVGRKVAAAVSTASTLNEALDAFAAAVRPVLEYRRISYATADDEELTIVALAGHDDGIAMGATRPVAIFDHTQRASLHPLVITKFGELQKQVLSPIRSLMSVPVVVAGTVRASVTILSLEEDAYDEPTLTFFTGLVGQAAGAFHHLYLLGQEQESAERLRAIDALRSDFVAMVAHDLRMPISVVTNTADLLATDWTRLSDEERAKYLGNISQRLRRLSRFVEDMLHVVRIESGDFAEECTDFDLRNVVEGVVNEFRTSAAACSIVVEMDEMLPLIYGDERRQWQILGNLLSNACKFSPEGGEVRVHVHREDDKVRVAVIDQGIGMREQDLDRLFQKFSRLPQPGDGPEIAGSGLGLYISSRLIQAQGGRIDVVSAEGVGSTFSYTVPVAS